MTARANGQALALRLFRLLPPGLYRRLRWSPLAGAGRRLLDATLPGGGVRPTRVLGGPLRGMVLDLDPRTLKLMAVGRHEPEVQRAIEEHLGPGQTAFDVGAHVGYASLLMAGRVGPGGKVVAFEPDPDVLACLRGNLTRNLAAAGAVVAVERAVAAAAGGRPFVRRADTATGHLHEGPGALAVQVTTLDDAAAEHGLPDLVKVDVEGGELAVLSGAPELLAAGRTTFVIEAHSAELERDCAGLLEAAGWRCHRLPATGGDVHLLGLPPRGRS